jgi:hypothetical protein
MTATFTASVTGNRDLAIERVHKYKTDAPNFRLELAPQEVELATYLVGFTMGLKDMDSVPDYLENSPMVVRIFPRNEGFALERQDRSGSMPFHVKEADELIRILNQGRDMAINARQQAGPARPVGLRGGMTHDEVIG